MSNTETRRGQRSEVRGQGLAFRRRAALCLLIAACCLLAVGCRQDMQDQPRYEAYESSKSFGDGLSSRPYVEGTVPRGYLKADATYYTGKTAGAQQMNVSGTPGAGGGAQTTTPNSQGANAGGQAAGSGDVNARGQNTGGNIPASSGQQQVAGLQGGNSGNVNAFPFPITAEGLDRGEERFKIYCSMCHGQTGFGDGMIVRRGFRRPPSLHDERLRQEPLGHFFDVITNGWGAMPDYSTEIPPGDRWLIIAYIRALQLSQNTPVAEVPENLRNQRKPGPGTPTTEGGHQGTGGERTP